jgi:hypothetical protein
MHSWLAGGDGNGRHCPPDCGSAGQRKVHSAIGARQIARRKRNAEYRSREHLTEREVERLIEAMKGNRWGHRDATMVFLAYRHGLRAAELVDLRWEQIDLEHAFLHVRRLKNGSPATHPLTGKELRALKRLQREQAWKSPFVFISERGAPFSRRGFQLYRRKFGEFLPLIRRQDVKGFVARRPIWLNRPLGLDAVRKFAEEMEFETARFYRRAAEAAHDNAVRDLLMRLAAAEDKHEKLAQELGESLFSQIETAAPKSRPRDPVCRWTYRSVSRLGPPSISGRSAGRAGGELSRKSVRRLFSHRPTVFRPPDRLHFSVPNSILGINARNDVFLNLAKTG